MKDCSMPLAARRALRCAGDGVGGKRPGEIPGHYLSVAKRHTAVRLRCTSARPPTPAASMGGRRSSEGTTPWEGGGVHAYVRQRRMKESENRRSHLCARWCQICRQAQVESECALQAGQSDIVNLSARTSTQTNKQTDNTPAHTNTAPDHLQHAP